MKTLFFIGLAAVFAVTVLVVSHYAGPIIYRGYLLTGFNRGLFIAWCGFYLCFVYSIAMIAIFDR